MTNRVWWLGFALLASACGEDPVCGGGLEYDRAERRCVCPRGFEYVCTTENDCECVASIGDGGIIAVDANSIETDSAAADSSVVDGGPIDARVECAEGESTCGGRCVDTLRDELHCGRCGSVCETRMICSEGECIDPVVGIAAGNSHACALRAFGGVWCWGYGRAGQIGNGVNEDRVVATEVLGLPVITEISAAPELTFSASVSSFTCARGVDGSVWCWGANDFGQLGDGTVEDRSVPVRVADLTMPARSVIAGGSTTCAVLLDRTVRCWGSNQYGQLGNGIMTPDPQLTPVQVPRLTDVASADLEVVFAAATTVDGRVLWWGPDLEREGAMEPVEVPSLRGSSAIAVNPYGFCGLIDGRARCVGVGYARGIDSDSGFVATAEPVVGLDDALDVIAAGGENFCAVGDDGVVCWGRRDIVAWGEGGAGFVPASPPRLVPNTRGATHVAVATTFACAVIDGRPYCWGANEFGQLGNGSRTGSGVPVPVLGLFD